MRGASLGDDAWAHDQICDAEHDAARQVLLTARGGGQLGKEHLAKQSLTTQLVYQLKELLD
jgi:hypothetical protein